MNIINTRLIKKQHSFAQYAVRLTDICAVVAAGFLSFVLRDWPVPVDPLLYFVAIATGSFYTILIFSQLGLYEEKNLAVKFFMVRRTVIAWTTVSIMLALTAFLTKTGEHYSRVWFVMWCGYAFICLLLLRLALLALLNNARRKGWNNRTVLVVGTGELARDVARSLRRADWSGIQVVGFVNENQQTSGMELDGKKIVGTVSQLADIVASVKPDELWISLPLKSEDMIKDVLFQMRHSTATIRMVPDIFNLRLLNHSVSEIGGIPVLNLCESPMSGSSRYLKFIEDKLLSIMLLMISIPMLLLIAVAIKLTSSGPVLYRQERVGWNGRTFTILKFRTMPEDAEKATGPVWATGEDNRATSLGIFLRKTSLDELPQFINVLKGDMSIVGPRPERPVFVEQFKDQVPDYMKKHMVKAGITGWAQINGWRGDTDINKRIEYDLYYIENWSVWFDIKIILLTLVRGFLSRNAY
jgi:putative colanic acid biosynthesis UDP-glucose lipid carrier transferase